MATKLDKKLVREVEIGGDLHTITLTPQGVKITRKGFRLGREFTWEGLKNAGTVPEAKG